jgi:hypothetical protein
VLTVPDRRTREEPGSSRIRCVSLDNGRVRVAKLALDEWLPLVISEGRRFSPSLPPTGASWPRSVDGFLANDETGGNL